MMKISDLCVCERSSALKRGELKGVILSVTLSLKRGDVERENKKMQEARQNRKKTQPGPSLNLGSIYGKVGRPTFMYYAVHAVAKCYRMVFKCVTNKTDEVLVNEGRLLVFKLLGASDLIPYVYNWNRFVWRDVEGHRLFWKYHKLHQHLFSGSEFEIEIKGNK